MSSCVQDENLKILISNFGKKDWKTIASFLPVSTQRMNEWIGNVKFSKTEDNAALLQKTTCLLLWQGRTEFQCMHRWKKHLDPDLVKGYWSKEEDEKVEKIHRPSDTDLA